LSLSCAVRLDPGDRRGRRCAFEIARRSRGTPRVANRLLRRARDFAQVRAQATSLSPSRTKRCKCSASDQHGLDEVDRNLMLTILQKYSGGPVGSIQCGFPQPKKKTPSREIYEPYLMQLGLLDRTQRGRVATALAISISGSNRPASNTACFRGNPRGMKPQMNTDQHR